MKVFRIFSMVAVLTAPAFAIAQQAESGSAAPPKSVAKSTDPVVCRTDNELGSRIAKRKICMKVSEWREAARESGDWAEHKETYLGRPGDR